MLDIRKETQEPLYTFTEWQKIECFLEEQTKLYFEAIHNNDCSSHFDRNKMKLRYENTYNCLSAYIENGIETGEFAPEYPVSTCVELLITVLEGLQTNSRLIYSDEKIVIEQMNIIREQLRDVLVVL
jgi:hypothetical protein